MPGPVSRGLPDRERGGAAAAVRWGRGYRYLHEGIDVLATVAPGLHGALLAARSAEHSHVNIDGTLIRTAAARPSVRLRK